MASISRTTVGRRLGVLIAGAAVLTALMAATAAAAPTTIGVPGSHIATTPRSPSPGFLLDRGRYTTIEAPGVTEETAPAASTTAG